MKNYLETTIGRVVLSVIVLIIWGVNAFNFSQLAKQESSTIDISSLVKKDIILPAKVYYVYKASLRDPFVRSGQVQKVDLREADVQKKKYVPEIILNGIFGKSVMLTLNGNEVVFKSLGEFLEEGIMLKRIFADSVHLEIEDDLITLTVNNQ